jgi:thiol-disulfide isomerase/thioredoxin
MFERTNARVTAMRRWSASLASVALAAALNVHAAAGAAPPAGMHASPQVVQRALKEHALTMLDGKSITLGAMQGQVVVVNFWASWCGPCRKELPALNTLHAELAPKGGRVIAVSIDYDEQNARAFAKANKLTLPIAHDGPDGLARQLDLGHVPFTMILDRTGEVVFTSSGSNAEALSRLSAEARQLVARTPYLSQAGQGGTP